MKIIIADLERLLDHTEMESRFLESPEIRTGFQLGYLKRGIRKIVDDYKESDSNE